MQTAFTEDQDAFREVVARFLQDKSEVARTRQLIETESGYDLDVWRQLCGEVGLAGTHIPEEFGGFGFGPIELGIIAEEMGRHLYCGPFFASSVMAVSALMNAANETAKSRLLPEISAGTKMTTLVMDSLNEPSQVGRSIIADADKLTGEAGLVVDAQNADTLVVIASEGIDLGLYCLSADADGVHITPVEALDPTRKIATVNLDDAAAERIGDVDAKALNRIWDEISVVLAHEMIGGAQQMLDTTVDYTKIRYQFGRPIGSFQGLKHRCADLLMEVEFAKAATHYAAFCLAAGDGEPYVASMAKAMASDTYMKAAKEAIQMRGGIGFTWEEDVHFWYKRAKSSEVFMGTPTMHRERMMQMVETGGMA